MEVGWRCAGDEAAEKKAVRAVRAALEIREARSVCREMLRTTCRRLDVARNDRTAARCIGIG